MCTRHLADLGARVLKIENPAGGDFTRSYDQAVRGMSGYFVWLGRGKESVALDLKDAAGQATLQRLIARADVLVQNLAPGAAERIGVGSAGMRTRHPRLVTVDISGYGQGGPYDGRRAYDLLVQAEAGACAMTGRPGDPVKPGPPLADLGSGIYAASGVLAALLERERTGQGAAISVAMLDVVADWMGWALNQSLHTGTDPQPVGMGSPLVAPYGAYRTADGLTAVLGTTNDAEWQRLAGQMLADAALAADPRFRHNPDRVRQREALDTIIGGWAAERTLAQIQAAADDAGIGCARLNSLTDVVHHPQLAARQRWSEVDSPVGKVPSLLPPVTGPWGAPMGGVPALGEHTDAVLAEFAELSED